MTEINVDKQGNKGYSEQKAKTLIAHGQETNPQYAC
jgi:hypothetical protein